MVIAAEKKFGRGSNVLEDTAGRFLGAASATEAQIDRLLDARMVKEAEDYFVAHHLMEPSSSNPKQTA